MFRNSVQDEKKTLKVMIAMYCNSHHNTNNNTLCNDCASLTDYSIMRIDHCIFGIDKPSCEKCLVHCYDKDERDEIRKIMRYSGPRMLLRHPILTIKHFFNVII